MNKFFTLLLFSLYAFSLSAQITLESSEFLFEYGVPKSWIHAENEAEAIYPVAGEDMLWDFTNLIFNADDAYDNATIISYDGDVFPTANGVVSTQIESELFPGVLFQTDFYKIYNEDTDRTIGRVSEEVLFPLESLTGVATDSLIYLETLNEYTHPVSVVNFPLNYGDTVQVGTNDLYTDIVLTATPFGLDHVPGVISAMSTSTAVIDGWGKIRINEPVSGLPVEIPVLMRTLERVSVDSFHLGGAPAPQSLLDAFGQTQGSMNSYVNYAFYAEGFPHEFMDFRDDTDDTEDYAIVNAAILGYVSSLYTPAEELIDITTAPNPANGAFSLDFIKTNAKDWTFEMIDMQGKSVHQQLLGSGVGQQQIRIEPIDYAAGTHAYIVRDELGKVIGSGKIMLK